VVTINGEQVHRSWKNRFTILVITWVLY